MRSVIRGLLIDIGGVLLTNGWDRKARKRAAEHFRLDHDELNERHHLTFDTYEEGKLSLDEYLSRVIFHESRSFSPDDFKTFIFSQSSPYPQMLRLIQQIREQYGVKTIALSNEGREIHTYRVQKFGLENIIDFFVVSCFLHYRKPDKDLYQAALDMAQLSPNETLYIEDRTMFVEVAESMGINCILHKDYPATRRRLFDYGLEPKG